MDKGLLPFIQESLRNGEIIMATNIVLIIVAVMAIGLSIWCWWFENGGPDDDDDKEQQTGEDEKQNI